MDIGVNLVESYLRLAGYLTLSEFEVQGRRDDGAYETITDVDIVAVRFPGNVYVGDPHNPDCSLLLIDDPALLLDPGCVDVIVGEVKQGEATINAGLTDHRTLHAVLQRINWVYDGDVAGVVDELGESLVSSVPSRGGGTVRTRIVAFGQAPMTSLNVVTHTHIVNTLVAFFEEFDAAFRPVQFKEPAIGFLRLLAKSGFEVERPD
jgi:hypothetical protein